jgi:transcriptional regulator with GAF, ATPase, and Fis domain
MNERTLPGSTLVVTERSGSVLEYPNFRLIDRQQKSHKFDLIQVRIGAGPGNDLILDDPTVSSVHLEIHSTANGFRLRDLGSTNGTKINDVAVNEAFLQHGQTIYVGAVPLVFEVGDGCITEQLSEKSEFHGAVGQSVVMRTVFSRVERAARTDATVLIQGATGTGKEVIAWSVYEASKRADKPFVVLDCGAIAPTLIESELFGHEKGAFTGAVGRRKGAFERAHGGTIFLDELGELSVDLQPKLLRVLERKEIQRVGGEETIPVNVRIIAATNRDLRSMVARGEFREDLYYRMAVVPLELPPLSERKEDIKPLVQHFLNDMGGSFADLPDGALNRFLDHNWPGNCRELRNAVERAVVLGETTFLERQGEPTSNPASLTTPQIHGSTGEDLGIDTARPYKEQKSDMIARFEKAYVIALMREFDGNVSAASRRAGIDRMSLHKILNRYELDARALARDQE